MTLLAGLALCLLLPQETSLSGRVVDQAGHGVQGASVELAALPLLTASQPGVRGSYRVAMALQRERTTWPKTATDRSGSWRVLLTPAQAAMLAAAAVETELVVRKPGFACWRRSLGRAPLAHDGIEARLSPPGAGLTLHLVGHKGAYLGYVLVERACRATGSRTIWLQDLLELPGDGHVRFPEPARVPGEVLADAPSVRPEAYRITLFAADLEPLVAFVGEGRHELRVTPREDPRRKILAERATPALPPVEASYRLAGREVSLRFDQPAVPLLGNEAPYRIHCASGPVPVDAWDPDTPLFVGKVEAESKPDAAEAAGPFADLQLSVQRKELALPGVGVWIEDVAAKAMAADGGPFALTDATGKATLTRLPHGAYRVLLRHLTFGQREQLVTIPGAGPVEITLARPPAAEPAPEPLAGSLLLDLGPAPQPAAEAEGRLEVGIVLPDGKLARRQIEDVGAPVRIDGLVPGPVTFYVRRGQAPPTFCGGVLVQGDQEPAFVLPKPAPRQLHFTVLDSAGQPLERIQLSLAETQGRSGRLASSDLFAPVATATKGRFVVPIAVHGSLWVRVHGAEGEMRDVLVPPENPDGVVDLRLQAPDPEAAATTRPRR